MKRQTWPIARLLFGTHLPFLVLVWAGLVVVVAGVIAGFAIFATVKSSKWDQAGSIVRWLALGYGAYLTNRMLPMCIAHGQTRRDFMAQVTVFMVAAAAPVAALMTLGYALEGLLYRAGGWPQRVSADRLFEAPDQWPHIFVAYWALLLIWTIAGALLAAGFYRSSEHGVVTIPVGVVLVVLGGVAIGFNSLPFIGRLLGFVDLPLAAAVAICAAVVALGIAATWAVVRDLPMRTRLG